MYVVWGNATSENFQFLFNKYQSIFPDHEFNWNSMLETLGLANTPPAVIQNLLQCISPTKVRLESSPWGIGCAYRPRWQRTLLSSETFCFLAKCSIASRVKAIGTKHLRDCMSIDLLTVWPESHRDRRASRRSWLDGVQSRLVQFESEYLKLKETTSLLEFALWKAKMIESSPDKVKGGRNNTKLKMDASDFRMKCCIICRADHVIENILPYLLPLI
jgi:hypothetical protein